MSSVLLKFEHTSMVFSNLVWSPSEHPRKKALHPMPQGKGLGLELEFVVMDRRKSERQRGERVN